MKRNLKKYDNYFFDHDKNELTNLVGKVKNKYYCENLGFYFKLLNNDSGEFDKIRLSSIILELEDVDYKMIIKYVDGNNKNVSRDNLICEEETYIPYTRKKKYGEITNDKKHNESIVTKSKKQKSCNVVDRRCSLCNNKLTFYRRRLNDSNDQTNRYYYVNYQRLILQGNRISLYESVNNDNFKPKPDFPKEININTSFTTKILDKYKFIKYTPKKDEVEFFNRYERDKGIIKK